MNKFLLIGTEHYIELDGTIRTKWKNIEELHKDSMRNLKWYSEHEVVNLFFSDKQTNNKINT